MTAICLARSVNDLVSQRLRPQFDVSGTRLITAPHAELKPRLRHSQSRLRAQADDLVAREGPKDESLAILLHELRSPLASIQNAVAALRLGSKDESFQRHMHELIERQVRQMALLTSNVGQMSAARLEIRPLQGQRIDLCTVLSRAAETVIPEITQRQHQLSLSLPQPTIWILGDASRLEEVFVNLLSNASKYSGVGGKIEMSVHVYDGHASVQVRDFGIGIAADSMPYIFDLFMRVDAAAVQTQSGLGIGLALVRSIVDSHRGTVWAVSEGTGQGTKFTVRLKLEL